MKTYELFLLALAWGALLVVFYLLGAIPAWLAIIAGWVGGLCIYARFA